MIDYSKVAQVVAMRWSPITATLCTSVSRQRKTQQKLASVVQQELLAAQQADGDDPVAAALKLCHLLRDRAAQMKREEFHLCLHRAIGADRSYCDNIFHHFQNNPAAFLAHRTPQTQSVELLKFGITENEVDDSV
jgi:hypothetical protein